MTRLRDAAGKGQIDLEELEQRITATYEARTVPELAPIVADLDRPEPDHRGVARQAPRSPKKQPLNDAGLRAHLTCYLLVIGFLVGIWALSGFGHPWPFYPAAGWGIGLGAHWQAVTLAQHHNSRRDVRQGPREHPSIHAKREQLERRARRTMERLEHRADRERKRLHQLGVPTPPNLPGVPGMSNRSPAPARHPAGADAAPKPADDEEAAPEDAESTPAPPTRRYVVAEFVDIVGSTQLNEALGDDGWVRIRGHFRALVADCVTDAGGYEANTAGDGMLLRFEHPTEAVRCGAEILRRLEQQRAQTGFAPSVRIGVHSGDAMSDGDDIIGSVVNLASRVADAAQPDELWCTEHVADHLDGSWSTQGKGLHTLKGINRPRHLLAVRWR